ncbi:MAG: flagellar protein FlaG [Deltaproteobacteria bacterium]|nr:flagellar protein FlaG [Deltaproteobacteria bacterium]
MMIEGIQAKQMDVLESNRSHDSPANVGTQTLDKNPFLPGARGVQDKNGLKLVDNKQSQTGSGGAGRGDAGAEQVQGAADKLNAAFELKNIGLRYTVDKQQHKVITKLINQDTGEVIREIPPKHVMDLANNLQDSSGVLFDQRI